MISTEKGIRIAGIANDSIVDGPGLRITFFFQGCRHGCEGCHNPESWPLAGGEETDAAALLAKIDANPLLQGVTFSGGEPLLRAGALLPLAEGILARGLPLAIYTGYTFEEILASGDREALALLACADTLIDGPFVLAQKSLTLSFRGSHNQRILDTKASLKAAAAVPQTAPEWNYRPLV
ncbi:MAG: anaerobic ribonucleoside-triphosphate reductase activating protein [Clostridiales Family XIII bacterium]|jgi:anaerobic ribonucleoside-triphosphate reductase activating protein|nr:anaerobic ribonucleoside-triphosphate reductase activating protein [Clostridiales Family XIII bacterium]